MERPNLVIVKRDGTRQSFDRAKVMMGIERATEKTKVTAMQKEELVTNVEKKLYETGEAELPSTLVGELVMKELAELDDVAYVRFASVYRHFTSIEGFEKVLNKLRSKSDLK
jgi:transcriptional repressor NrdR